MTLNTLPTALIVAGPTASGKSALALWLAQQFDGVIINADSMQVYRELRIVTARPSLAEERTAPHTLYGIRPAALAGSVAWWRETALAEMCAAHAANKLPILCGGTGLYFASLTQGLADIPPPSEVARQEARALLAADGPEALHARLTLIDPVTAARLHPSDGQRLARAFEVWRSTGRGLAEWQAEPARPVPWNFAAIQLDPPRDALRPAIAARFGAMLEHGALAEIDTLLSLNLDASLPAMRAHGVPELAAHIRGDISLAEATSLIELATARYTKRQTTWMRHHSLAENHRSYMIHARFLDFTQFSERENRELTNFIQSLCLTPRSIQPIPSLSAPTRQKKDES